MAFKMQLHEGCEKEYRERHERLWPELAQLLKASGISDYSIFHDETSNELFGTLQIESADALDLLPGHPVMQRWWDYMKDIMQTNPDNSPCSVPLKRVFYLP